jgi:DNA topoisomerase IA
MSPSQTERTTVLIGFEQPENQTEIFQATYDRLTFEGYQKLWGKTAANIDEFDNNSNDDDDNSNFNSLETNQVLLGIEEGDQVTLDEIHSKQKASRDLLLIRNLG